MLQCKLPESSRLARLHQLGILDTEGDKYFRAFAEQAMTLLPGSTMAAISLVDTERQWFKTVIGLHVKETPRCTSFCSHTIESTGAMTVEDATQDARFADNPLVTSHPRIRFYAGVKLVDGVGALCVLGSQPRRVTEREISNLMRLARYADIQLLAHGALHQLHGKTSDDYAGVKQRSSASPSERASRSYLHAE